MARKKIRSNRLNRVPSKLKCSTLIKPHIETFESFIKAYPSSGSHKYKIGSFTVFLHDAYDSVNDLVAYLHFKDNSTECFLWWEETNIEVEKQVFSYATCEVPYDVLKALTSQNQFHLIWETTELQTKSIDISVCVSSNAIVPLSYASEPHLNRFRSKVQTVVKYFQCISSEEYGKDFIDEEDHVEKVYECIKNRFNPNEKVVNMHHPFLNPKLRKYQSQAVRWMLRCELRESWASGDEVKDHVLYSELLLSDGSKLYYHNHGGFFVTQQFKSLPLARGGILADEMGLGKTVEVLSCILLHPRVEFNSQVNHTNFAPNVSSELSEDKEFSSNRKRKKKITLKNDNIIQESKRQKRNCNTVQDKQFKCRKCGLIQDIDSRAPVDLFICPLCSDDTFDVSILFF